MGKTPTTAENLKLRRVVPGYYVTPCGRYEVTRVEHDEDCGFGKVVWYWADHANRDCAGSYGTKWEAKSALRNYLAYNASTLNTKQG